MGQDDTYRILLVDDEPLIGSVVRSILRPIAQVEVFGTTIDARRHLERGAEVDAILCDLTLGPGDSGADLYYWVMQHQPGLSSRIAFITGGAWTVEASRFLEEAAPPYLMKPFTRDELLAFVRSLLEARDGANAAPSSPRR